MKVNVQYAKEHFTDILDAAKSGDAVEIMRSDQSTYRLTLVKSSTAEPKDRRILGAGRGELRVPSWEKWKVMDAEMEHEMCDAPLITTGEI